MVNPILPMLPPFAEVVEPTRVMSVPFFDLIKDMHDRIGASSQTAFSSVSGGPYTVTNANKSTILALGGNAFYTVTFGAVAGYDSDFTVTVLNTDAAACKTIALTGGPTFKLWPLQTVFVFVQGGGWKATHYGTPWAAPTGATQIFVDVTNGSDVTGDGLATGTRALKTIQFALNTIRTQIDVRGNTVSVKLADGVYTESVDVFGHWRGTHVVGIIGNVATPTNCQWVAGPSGYCCYAKDYGCVQILGVYAYAPGAQVFKSEQYAIIDVGPAAIGIAGSQLIAANNGVINYIGDITIFGGANYHLYATTGGVINVSGPFVLSIPSPLGFLVFAAASYGGIINAGSTLYSGAGVAGTIGQRFNVDTNGIIACNNVNTFPGNIPGNIPLSVPPSGGVYF